MADIILVDCFSIFRELFFFFSQFEIDVIYVLRVKNYFAWNCTGESRPFEFKLNANYNLLLNLKTWILKIKMIFYWNCAINGVTTIQRANRNEHWKTGPQTVLTIGAEKWFFFLVIGPLYVIKNLYLFENWNWNWNWDAVETKWTQCLHCRTCCSVFNAWTEF